jgi:hypothetical protein
MHYDTDWLRKLSVSATYDKYLQKSCRLTQRGKLLVDHLKCNEGNTRTGCVVWIGKVRVEARKRRILSQIALNANANWIWSNSTWINTVALKVQRVKLVRVMEAVNCSRERCIKQHGRVYTHKVRFPRTFTPHSERLISLSALYW